LRSGNTRSGGSGDNGERASRRYRHTKRRAARKRKVSIVTEAILRRWYKDSGGDLQKLVDAGVTSREVPESAYLTLVQWERAREGGF